jgi:ribonuclease HII
MRAAPRCLQKATHSDMPASLAMARHRLVGSSGAASRESSRSAAARAWSGRRTSRNAADLRRGTPVDYCRMLEDDGAALPFSKTVTAWRESRFAGRLARQNAHAGGMPRRDSSPVKAIKAIRSTLPAPAGPDLFHEREALRAGARLVAGVDEAGRGPLAGPVVVAAVVLDMARVPEGLDDSKKLLPERREALFVEIMASATVSVVAAPHAVIAERNILGATLWAMRRAVLGLSVRPDHVLVDGNRPPPRLPVPGTAIIGGDGLSCSIAAASIVAKVTRDRMCGIMHMDAPDFGFAAHKGYCTPEHLDALDRHGPCRHHRMDFAPCAEALARRRVAAE